MKADVQIKSAPKLKVKMINVKQEEMSFPLFLFLYSDGNKSDIVIRVIFKE